MKGWTCLAALVLGSALGWLLAPKQTPAIVSSSEEIARTGLDLTREASRIPLSFRQQLELAVYSGDSAGNRVRLLRLLEPQTTVTIIALADYYSKREQQIDSAYTILEVVYRIWSHRDPKGYLMAIQRQDRVYWSARASIKDILLGMPPTEATRTLALFHPELRFDLKRMLIESDPAYAYSLYRESALAGLPMPYFEKLVAHDPDKAAELVASMPDGRNKWSAQDILEGKESPIREAESQAKDLMAMPAEEAAKAIADLKPGYQQNDLIAKVLPKLIVKDREAALTWVKSLPSLEARAAAERELLLYDATGVPTPFSGMPPPPGQKAQAGPLERIAATPEAFKAHLAKFPESVQSEIATRFVHERRQRDPKAASELILALPPGPVQYAGLRTLSQHWAQDDPDSATEFTSQLPALPEYLKWVEEVARDYAAEDPEAAFEWATSLESEGYRRAAMRKVAPNLLRTDTSEAVLSKLQSLPDIHARGPAVREFLQQWGVKDMQSAATTAAELGDTEALTHLFQYSREQLPQATEALSSINEAGTLPIDSQQTLTATLANVYASTNATEALQWAQSLEDSNLQAVALETTVSSWARADAAAASQFVSEYTNPTYRDSAVSGLAQGTMAIDPEAAFQWSTTITDTQLREQSLQEVIRKWHEADAAAAEAAISQNENLKAGERTKLREVIQ